MNSEPAAMVHTSPGAEGLTGQRFALSSLDPQVQNQGVSATCAGFGGGPFLASPNPGGC